MRHTEVFVLLVFVTAALARNVDEPLLNRFRRRASKMTALWRKNNGMGTFRDAGTAGGNAISNEPAKPVVLECTTEGFFPQPGSCTNFYRCVDWLGTGTYFSTFKFNCPPGTVFDDDLDICNHPGAVRNPPECSGGLVILPSPVPPVVDTTTTTTITAGAETSSTAITEETTVSSQGTTGVTGSSGGSDGTTNQGGAGNSGNQGDSGSLGGSGGIGSPSIGGQEGAGSNQGGQNSSVNQGSVDGQGGSSGTSVSSQGETGVTGQGGSGGIGGGSETGDPESGNSGVQGGPGSIGGQDGSDGVGNQGAGGVGSIGGISGLGGQGGTDSSSAQEGSGGLGSSGASQGTQGVGSNPGVVSGGSIPGSEPTIIAPGISPGAISGGSGGSNPESEPTVISSGNDGNLGDIDSNGSESSQNGDGNTGNVGQGGPDVSISGENSGSDGAPGNVGGSGSTSDPSAVGSPDDFGGPGGVDSTESTGSSTSPSGSDGLEGTGGSGDSDGVSTSGVSSQGGNSGVTEGAGAVSEAPTRPFSLECHQDNSYRRHPMYCNRYYYCLWDGENWTFPIFTCPAALVFDENSQQCSYPDDTEPCESSLAPFPTPETTTEVEMESTTFPTFIETTTAGKVWEIEESSVFPCPAPGYYPYEGDCQRFYKCVETEAGKLKDLLYKCPTGFGYSEERRRCARLEDLPPCDRSTEIAHERFDSATPLYPEDLLWFFKNRK